MLENYYSDIEGTCVCERERVRELKKIFPALQQKANSETKSISS